LDLLIFPLISPTAFDSKIRKSKIRPHKVHKVRHKVRFHSMLFTGNPWDLCFDEGLVVTRIQMAPPAFAVIMQFPPFAADGTLKGLFF
jgi:hypothetical protein